MTERVTYCCGYCGAEFSNLNTGLIHEMEHNGFGTYRPECMPSAVSYIDKEAAKDAVRDTIALYNDEYGEIDKSLDALPVVKIPTPIRCGFCQNGLRNMRNPYDRTVFCMNDNKDRDFDFYCSDGSIERLLK